MGESSGVSAIGAGPNARQSSVCTEVDGAVAQLQAMGFSRDAATDALRKAGFDVAAAANLLLS